MHFINMLEALTVASILTLVVVEIYDVIKNKRPKQSN